MVRVRHLNVRIFRQQPNDLQARIIIPLRPGAEQLHRSCDIARYKTALERKLAERPLGMLRVIRRTFQQRERAPLVLRPALALDQHVGQRRQRSPRIGTTRTFKKLTRTDRVGVADCDGKIGLRIAASCFGQGLQQINAALALIAALSSLDAEKCEQFEAIENQLTQRLPIATIIINSTAMTDTITSNEPSPSIGRKS